MSTFATSFLSGSVGDAAQLAADILSLASKADYTSGTSLAGPILGDTWTLIANRNGTAVAADEEMDVEADMNWSGETAGDRIEIGLFWGGVEVSSKQIKVPTGANGTDGLMQVTPLVWQLKDTAATANLELMARVVSGSGGLYYRSRHLKYKISKRRA